MSSSFRSPCAAAVRATLASVTLASAVIAGGKASAATWDLNPRIEAGAEYSDNYRLAPSGSPKVAAYGTLADASVTARLLDPRYEIDISPRIRNTFLPNDHTDQSTDGYIDVGGNYHTQRGTFGGTLSYYNESVIASELLPANFPGVTLGQVVGEASGIVSFHNRRVLERVAPNMTYDLAPRYHLKFDAQYENASFSQNVIELQNGTSSVFAQEGFKDYYGSAGVQYDVTQRYDVVVRLIGAKFLPDRSMTSTERYGAEAVWEGRPGSILQYYGRVGVEEVHANTLADGNINKTLVVGGAGASWTYQLSQYTVDAIRDLSPSASGAVVEHDELRFRLLHALTPRLYTVVAARGVRVRGASQNIIGIVGSDYVAATASLQYQITRNYRVSAEYEYTWQHFQNEPRAMSNGVAVSLIWQPLSRFNPVPDYNRLPLDRSK